MGKLLRIVVIVLLALVALVVVAAIALPFVLDPNDYKEKIAQLVEDNTGRTLQIEGDIGLSFFPWLGMEMGQTRLSNASGFGDQPFAKVDEVQIRLKLLPLLRKQVEMDTVVLVGLQLQLAKNAKGVSNWDDLTGRTDTAPADPAEAGSMALAGLVIGGVRLENGAVQWQDHQAGSRYDLEQINLSSGAIVPGNPVDLELSLQVTANKPALAGAIALQGEVLVSDSLQQVTVAGLELTTDLQGEGLPGKAVKASLQTDVTLDLARQTLDLPKFVLQALGLKLTGNLAGTQIQSEGASFNGALALQEFVPRDLLTQMGVALDTADASVLSKADAQLLYQAGTRNLRLSEIQIRLDDSRITGAAGIDDFATSALRFDLALDQLDADRYLPPPPPEGAVAVPPTAAAAAGASELPLETLRGLNLAGSLRVAKLKAFRLQSTDVLIQVKAKDGVMRINPAEARLYQGQYRGDMTFNVQGKVPRFSMNERVNGVQAGPLLKDMTGDDRLTGNADVRVTLTGSGATPEAMRRTLNGDAAFAFTDGKVKGVDLAAMIEKARAVLRGQPAPAENTLQETSFTEIRGTATVNNGVVRNEDLVANSPYFRINGRGSADLGQETIDYLIKAKIVGSPVGQGAQAMNEFKGLVVPVQIGGTFAAPTYKVMLDQILKDKLEAELKSKLEGRKEEVNERVEEKKQELQDKLKNQMEDKLKGLFR